MPDVAALVQQMHETLSGIHETIASLDPAVHDEKLDALESQRDSLFAELQKAFQKASDELTQKRQSERDEIAEKRRREDEELAARRKREDEELGERDQTEDSERTKKLEGEKERVEDDTEAKMDEVEEEAKRLLDEGHKKIRELEDRRREINHMIDESMKAPLPPPPTRRRRGTTKSSLNGPGPSAEAAQPQQQSGPAQNTSEDPEFSKESHDTREIVSEESKPESGTTEQPPLSGEDESQDKSQESQPQKDKAQEDVPREDKPQEAKTQEDQPLDDKPEDDKPQKDEPLDDKPLDDKTQDDKTQDNKTLDDKTLDDKTQDDKTLDDKTLDDKTQDDKTQGDVAHDDKGQKDEPQQDKPLDDKHLDDKPQDDKPQDGALVEEASSERSEHSPDNGHKQGGEEGLPDQQEESAREAQAESKDASEDVKDEQDDISAVRQPQESSEDAGESHEPAASQSAPHHEEASREVQPESNSDPTDSTSVEEKLPSTEEEAPEESSHPAEQHQQAEGDRPASDVDAAIAHDGQAKEITDTSEPQSRSEQNVASTAKPEQAGNAVEENPVNHGDVTSGVVPGGAAEEYLHMADQSDSNSASQANGPDSTEQGTSSDHKDDAEDQESNSRETGSEDHSSGDQPTTHDKTQSNDDQATRNMSSPDPAKDSLSAGPASHADEPNEHHDDDVHSGGEDKPESLTQKILKPITAPLTGLSKLVSTGSEPEPKGDSDLPSSTESHQVDADGSRDAGHDESAASHDALAHGSGETQADVKSTSTEPTVQEQSGAEASDEIAVEPEVVQPGSIDENHESQRQDDLKTAASADPVSGQRDEDSRGGDHATAEGDEQPRVEPQLDSQQTSKDDSSVDKMHGDLPDGRSTEPQSGASELQDSEAEGPQPTQNDGESDVSGLDSGLTRELGDPKSDSSRDNATEPFVERTAASESGLRVPSPGQQAGQIENAEEILEGSGNGTSPSKGGDVSGQDSESHQAGEISDLSGAEPSRENPTHDVDNASVADEDHYNALPGSNNEQSEAAPATETPRDSHGDGDASKDNEAPSELSRDEDQGVSSASRADVQPVRGDQAVDQVESNEHPDTRIPDSQDPSAAPETGHVDSDKDINASRDLSANMSNPPTESDGNADSAGVQGHDIPALSVDEEKPSPADVGGQESTLAGAEPAPAARGADEEAPTRDQIFDEPREQSQIPDEPVSQEPSKPMISTADANDADEADEGLFAVPPTPRSEIDQTKPAHLRDYSDEDVSRGGSRVPSPLAAVASGTDGPEDEPSGDSGKPAAATEHADSENAEHTQAQHSKSVDESQTGPVDPPVHPDADARTSHPSGAEQSNEGEQPTASGISHSEPEHTGSRSDNDPKDNEDTVANRGIAQDSDHEDGAVQRSDAASELPAPAQSAGVVKYDSDHDNLDADGHDIMGMSQHVGGKGAENTQAGHDSKPDDEAPREDPQEQEASHLDSSHPSWDNVDSDGYDSHDEPFALNSHPKASYDRTRYATGVNYDGEGYGDSPVEERQYDLGASDHPTDIHNLDLHSPANGHHPEAHSDDRSDLVSEAVPTPTQNAGFGSYLKDQSQGDASSSGQFQTALHQIPDESAHTVQGTDDLFEDDEDDEDEDEDDESAYGEAVINPPERIVYQAHGDVSNVALGGNHSSTSVDRNSIISQGSRGHRSAGSRGSLGSMRETTPVRVTDGSYLGGPSLVRADWAADHEEALRPSSSSRVTPNLQPSTTKDTPDISPFALRNSPMAGVDPDDKGLSSSRWRSGEPQTPPSASRQPATSPYLAQRTPASGVPSRGASVQETPEQHAEPDLDPSMFMPRDVTNMPWHERTDSVPMSLHSQTTLSSGPSSPIHSSLAIDRHEPVIRDSWPTHAPGYQQYLSDFSGRPRGDSSVSNTGAGGGGGGEYDPFKPQDASGNGNGSSNGPGNKGSLYNPFAQRGRAESSVSAAPSTGSNSPGRGSMLFQRMRSVFEIPAAGGGETITTRPVSGSFHSVSPQRKSTDRSKAEDQGYDHPNDRRGGFLNEAEEEVDERSAFLGSSGMPSGTGRGRY